MMVRRIWSISLFTLLMYAPICIFARSLQHTIDMNHPSYQFNCDQRSIRFDFESVGKCIIPKRVLFQKTDTPDLFNLVMGDVDDFGNVDAYSESNNGDMEYVLATVIQIIIQFMTVNTNAIICIQGSTPERTRLY